MIGALFGRNLSHHRNLLGVLCLGMLLFEMLIVWFAVQFDRGPGIEELLGQLLPPAMRQLLATQLEMASFAGMVGFGFQHPFLLVCSIAFVTVSATIPAGERESGLLDLLMARPIARGQYLVASLCLVVVAAAVSPAMILAGAALALGIWEVPNAIPWTRYLPAAFGLLALLLAIGGYTLAIASAARRRGAAVAQAVGLTLVLFLLDLFADLWAPLRSVSWLSPFHYYDPVRASVLRSVPGFYPFVLLGLFGVGAAVAFWRFRQQDL